MKKAIQAKNLSRFLFLLRNCKYTHFTLDKSGFRDRWRQPAPKRSCGTNTLDGG